MNVLLINDSSCNPNWGDRAAAIALKMIISEYGGNITFTISEDELRYSGFHNYPDCGQEIVHKSKTKETLKLYIPPVILKIREKILASRYSTAALDIIPEKWENFEDCLKVVTKSSDRYSRLLNAIDHSDIIVIHGNGCMTGNGRIPRAELFLSYIAKKVFQKQVIIVNHTADFDHPNLLKIAENIYPLFDDVVFRDSISIERCKEICSGRVAADSSFLFKPIALNEWVRVARRVTYFDVWPDAAMFDPGRPYICIGGSSIYGKIQDINHLIDGISKLLEYLSEIYTGQIVLTVSDICDEKILRPIAKKYDKPLIGLTTPVQQVVDIMGNAEAYIGGRWHPSIFALRGGTPIISISSKTFKMRALAQMSGLASNTFDALNLEKEVDAIGYQLLNYLQQGNELRVKLRNWAEKESLKIGLNLSYLRKLSSNN